MKKKLKHGDKKERFDLPKIVPDKDSLWERVDKEIFVDGLYHEKNRISLQHAINNLPEIDPGMSVWTRVEEEMTGPRQISFSIKRIGQYAAVVAAILAIGILVGVKPKLNRITYSKEILEVNSEPAISNFTKKTNNLIAELCTEQPAQCQNPDFEKLKSELEYLLKEKQKLSSSKELYISDLEKQGYNEIIDKQIEDLTNRIIEFLSL